VVQAFHALDLNQNGKLSIDEVKKRFDPSRHPDVKAGIRTAEECQCEFLDMFSTHHSVTHGFDPSRTQVSLEEFTQYHQYVSAFIESDKMFKVFMSGVWNMDLIETATKLVGGVESRPAGVTPQIYGKNSREQWKYDMHRSFFGQLDSSPMKQQI
jgi:hypothetical protein